MINQQKILVSFENKADVGMLCLSLSGGVGEFVVKVAFTAALAVCGSGVSVGCKLFARLAFEKVTKNVCEGSHVARIKLSDESQFLKLSPSRPGAPVSNRMSDVGGALLLYV